MAEVRFLARFRDITKERSVNIEYNGNIKNLIDILTRRYGNEFKEALLDKEGNLREYMKILINSEDIGASGGLEAEVKEEDHIVFFQTIAGG